jgi:hypothetical protein
VISPLVPGCFFIFPWSESAARQAPPTPLMARGRFWVGFGSVLAQDQCEWTTSGPQAARAFGPGSLGPAPKPCIKNLSVVRRSPICKHIWFGFRLRATSFAICCLLPADPLDENNHTCSTSSNLNKRMSVGSAGLHADCSANACHLYAACTVIRN